MDRFSAQGLIYQQIFQLLEKSTGLHCSSSSQWLGLIKCILGGGMATVVLRTVCALLFGIKTQGLIPLLCPSPSLSLLTCQWPSNFLSQRNPKVLIR